jgi:putative ABC transport system permease protein
MRLTDFRVGLRILAKDPLYWLVAVLGMGVGLAVCLLLLGFARYSYQYDAQVPDSDNVYIIKHRSNIELGAPWYDQAPRVLLSVATTAPGVTSASGYLTWLPLTVQVNGRLQGLRSLIALPGFAEMMGLQVLEGDLAEALSRPDTFAITATAAKRLFGTTHVLGRTLLLRLDAVDQSSSLARIAAVLRDPPANTTIPFETLNGPNLALIPPPLAHEAISPQSVWPSNLLIHVRPGSSLAAITEVLQQAVDRAPELQKLTPEMRQRLGNRKVMDIRLARLRDAYFDHEVATNFISMKVDRGDATVVAGLVAIAILILALASINYVNLATIREIRRQREIAMRKVLGVTQRRLASQLVTESLLVSMLATAIGLLLAWLALPLFADLMNRDLHSVLSPGNIAAAMGLGLILGLLTAVYPAWIAFGVRPSLMLTGRPGSESLRSKRLRQTLSVLQVAVAMGLASFTAAIALQSRFAMDASPGFDPSSLLDLRLPVGAWTWDPNVRGLVATLSQHPAIAGIATSNDAVGRSTETWSTAIKREGSEAMTIDVKSVSPNFFEVYGIRPVAGRLFDSQLDRDNDVTPIVINSIAAHALGFASPQLAVGQSLLFSSHAQTGTGTGKLITKRIVGIAPEIRFYSLREPPHALAYDLWFGGTLTIRASGSIAEAIRATEAAWPQYFSNSVLDLTPAKDVYAANYADDARLARLLALATGIAMIIAAFGAYVLAADAVQRRTAEIALRRLFGARRWDIGKLIAGEIGTVVLLASVIAIPLAGIAIARYLASYTERTPIAFWTLVFALLATLVISTFAAARHAWAAMMLRPAIALQR